jgi:hypothetical protein
MSHEGETAAGPARGPRLMENLDDSGAHGGQSASWGSLNMSPSRPCASGFGISPALYISGIFSP